PIAACHPKLNRQHRHLPPYNRGSRNAYQSPPYQFQFCWFWHLWPKAKGKGSQAALQNGAHGNKPHQCPAPQPPPPGRSTAARCRPPNEPDTKDDFPSGRTIKILSFSFFTDLMNQSNLAKRFGKV